MTYVDLLCIVSVSWQMLKVSWINSPVDRLFVLWKGSTTSSTATDHLKSWHSLRCYQQGLFQQGLARTGW